MYTVSFLQDNQEIHTIHTHDWMWAVESNYNWIETQLHSAIVVATSEHICVCWIERYERKTMNNLYAIKGTPSNVVCIKQNVGRFEVSMSFDDSCGTMAQLRRGDLRIYDNSTDNNVTDSYFPNQSIVVASFDNFIAAVSMLRAQQ